MDQKFIKDEFSFKSNEEAQKVLIKENINLKGELVNSKVIIDNLEKTYARLYTISNNERTDDK